MYVFLLPFDSDRRRICFAWMIRGIRMAIFPRRESLLRSKGRRSKREMLKLIIGEIYCDGFERELWLYYAYGMVYISNCYTER